MPLQSKFARPIRVGSGSGSDVPLSDPFSNSPPTPQDSTSASVGQAAGDIAGLMILGLVLSVISVVAVVMIIRWAWMHRSG